MPTFSVLVPNYNYRHYLEENVESVLAQTFADFELIVADDCSTDDSWEYLQSITDERVRPVRAEVNSGVAAAINLALREATGDYIAVLGADDRYRADFLAAHHGFLTENPSVDISGSYVAEIDADGELVVDTDLERWFNHAHDLNDPAAWIWGNRLAHGAVVCRRDVYDTVGWYDETLRITVDWNYWIRCLAAGKRFGTLPEQVFLSRLHGGNMSLNNAERTVRAYARTSAEHFHPYLFATAREDLVARNSSLFLRNPVVQDGDLAVAGEVIATLAGGERGGEALALAVRSAPGLAASLSSGMEDEQQFRQDIREAESARIGFWQQRLAATEADLATVIERNDELHRSLGDAYAQRDELQTQFDQLRGELAALRRRPPVRALNLIDRKRGELAARRRQEVQEPTPAHLAPERENPSDPVERDQPVTVGQPPVVASVVVLGDPSGMAESLSNQTLAQWEVVAVDASAEDTDQVRVTASAGRDPLAVGAGLARGSLVVISPPGVTPAPTALEEAHLALTRYPTAQAVAAGSSVALRSASAEEVLGSTDPVLAAPALGLSGPDVRDDALARLRARFRVPEDLPEDTAGMRALLQEYPYRLPSDNHVLHVFVSSWDPASPTVAALTGLLPTVQDHTIVVIGTDVPSTAAPGGFADYWFDLAATVGPIGAWDGVRSVLSRTMAPTVLIGDSRWAYQHIDAVRRLAPGGCRLVDLQLDHVSQVADLVEGPEPVDVVLAATEQARAVLGEYYGLPTLLLPADGERWGTLRRALLGV